jgi:transposase
VGQLSTQEPPSTQVPFLLQLPGVGMLSAMTILAAIGDSARFPSAKHLVGYAGLLARIHASGQVRAQWRVTRGGSRVSSERLWWRLPGSPSSITLIGRGKLSERAARIGTHKAIVAIARKLLVAVWHVLSRHCADIHGSRAGRRTHTAQLSRALWHAVSANAVPRPRSCVTTLINSDAGEGVEEIHSSGRVYRLSGTHREGETRLRAFLLPFLSGLRESTTPLLAVSTRALRAAPLRCAGLDTARACAVWAS